MNRFTLCAAALALGVSGCGSDDQESTTAFPGVNPTPESLHCTEGCLQAVASEGRFIEFDPPPSSRYGFHRFHFDEIESSFSVAPGHLVSYRTSVIQPSVGPISADLLFDPEVLLQEPVFVRARGSEAVNVHLYPGTYRVRIIPLDATIPPLEVEGFRVLAEPSPKLLDKEFILPETIRSLQGEVISSHQEDRGLAHVTVWAVGVESGLESGKVSTDLDGQFSLRLPTSAETLFTVRASPNPEDETPWIFEQSVRLEPGDSRQVQLSIDLPTTLERRKLSLVLRHRGTPVPRARVRLYPPVEQVGAQTFLLPVEGRSDETGRVLSVNGNELLVLAETTRALIEPPDDSPYASETVEMALFDDGSRLGATVELQLNPLVSGKLLQFDGPAVQATVEAFELGADRHRTKSTQTDEQGMFQLYLPPGEHLLYVGPGPARAAITAQLTMGQSSISGIEIAAPTPRILDVQIELLPLFDQASPSPEGATVSLWSQIDRYRVLLSNRAIADAMGSAVLEVSP